jgi:hypothetical protein
MAGDERVLFVCDFDGALFHKENRLKVINSHTAPLGSPMAVKEASRTYERIRSEYPAVSLLEIFAVDELLFPGGTADVEGVIPKSVASKTLYNHISKRHEPAILSSFDFRGMNRIFSRFFPPERGTPNEELFGSAMLLTTGINSAFFQMPPAESVRRKLSVLGGLLRRQDEEPIENSHRFDRIFFYYTEREYTAQILDFVQAHRADFAGGRNALMGFLIVDEKR